MKTRNIFLTAMVLAVFSSASAFGAIPAGNWDFQLQNSSASNIIYEGITGNCDTLIQNTSFAQGTTVNAFTTSVYGYGKCNTVLSYSGPNTACEITVSASAKEVNDTTTQYNATASYQGNCTGPTSLGGGGSYKFTVQ